MKLSGKKAVITGAGGGLGSAMALELAREGADVAVWDIRLAASEETCRAVEGMGRRAMSMAVDVTDEAAVGAAVAQVLEAWGVIDILINNAGICQVASIEETSAADWDRVLGVNLKGTFLCCRAVMGAMKRQRSGRIINLGSVAGKVGGISVGAHYSASKAAVMCFTKSLARELAPYGVNVNAIAPGVIESDMTRGITGGDWTHYLSTIPLGRIGRAEDVGRVAVFLAGGDSDYLTGEIIDVNGGQFMD
ncbi:MAG: SDR family oxidoreductase [Proteobacteria bacterium]|nr:SDR family oxidoreductase [Pseudomonadota bacterium]MBU2226310.1 SDR family oxidoreductase [Pseudomonadota bacterium]MBU2261101.1 SDR family oxidoreductase [Pseudomonadota bacterium]